MLFLSKDLGSPYFTFIHYNRERSLQKIWSGHNILRLFDVLPNFVSPQENGSVIVSNKRGIYTSRVTEQHRTYDLKKLGNITEISKPHLIIA